MNDAQNKVWFKDGILYSELHGIITLGAILDLQRQGVELIKQHNIDVAPNINIMTDTKDEDFKVKLSEFSKMISSILTVNHVSGIWIVDADEILRKKNEPLAKLFFSGKIRYVDTLEQAESEAREMIDSKKSVLAQD